MRCRWYGGKEGRFDSKAPLTLECTLLFAYGGALVWNPKGGDACSSSHRTIQRSCWAWACSHARQAGEFLAKRTRNSMQLRENEEVIIIMTLEEGQGRG